MRQDNDFWTELAEPLRRFIRRRVSDAAQAEDILQEVALKVESHREQLPPADKRSAWMLRIARNLIIDHRRVRHLRRHVPLAQEVPSDADPDQAPTAAEELSRCVRPMVELLPSPYAQALRLADLEGMDQQTIADHMGLSLSGAKSRVQRARRLLRGMVLDCCHIEQDARGRIIDYQPRDRAARQCARSAGGGPAATSCAGLR